MDAPSAGRPGSLSAERWQRLQALFVELDPLDAEAQQRRLDELHGEPGLVAELRGMLGAADVAADRLREAVQSGAAALAVADGPGQVQVIGRYRIEREIGRGGMGTVFEAVSADDYAQRVAIKVAGVAGAGSFIEARFALERQILAALVHPGIARFLDGGTTDGRPYFVMELVDGVPITRHCDERRLAVADRVGLIRQVCAAVHYAHQQLVVHRDLKPSNILVTADGLPKLLDFGIAKLLDPAGGASATLGALTWTPDYASPEQVSGHRVGIRSDVYSLGLVLYEVLTGQRGQVADTTSPLALSRSICETTPSPPSVRAAAAGQPAVAKACRGDLDTVVMTAIDKDPARRYGTAAELSDDLERALRGYPVRARPATVRYRTRRFVTRHRWGVAAAALLVISAAIGAASTAYQAQRAERRFQQVRALANAFVFDVHDQIATLPGSTNARKAIVGTALTYLENLRADAGGDDGLSQELADAYVKIGSVQGYPLLANLGDTAGALTSYARATELLTPLAERGQREAGLTLARVDFLAGNVLRSQGDRPAATAAFARATARTEGLLAEGRDIPVLNLLGELQADLARASMERLDVATASTAAERAMQIADEVAARSPADLAARDNLATAINALGAARLAAGALDEAAGLYRRSIRLREALVGEAPDQLDFQRGLIVSYGNLGDVLGYRLGQNLGDTAGAAEAFGQAARLARATSAADPNDRRARFDIVNAELRIGATLSETGNRGPDARDHLLEADRINGTLLAEEPGSARYGLAQLVIDRRLGGVLAGLGDSTTALSRTTAAIARGERLSSGPSQENARMQVTLARVQAAAVLTARSDETAVAAAGLAAAALDSSPPRPASVAAVTCTDLADTYVTLASRVAAQERPPLLARARDLADAADAAWREAVLPASLAPRREAGREALDAVRRRAERLRQ